MNKIVRSTIVAGELPERVRGDIDPSREVTVVVTETEAAETPAAGERLDLSRLLPPGEPREPVFTPHFGIRRDNFANAEEIVAWIRAVRDGEPD